MAEKYSIGTFAKLTGVTIRTLHYYDEISILKPELSSSGRRYYGDDHFIILQKIVTLKFLGFSLENIKDLIKIENWNLKESLIFQKKAMLEKRAQIDHIIKGLDSALNLVDEDQPVDSTIFISIINGILLEDDHKEWLENVLSKEKVQALFDIPQEEQFELEKRWALLLTELKNVCGSDPNGEESQLLMKEMFTLFTEIVGVETSAILQMNVPEDPSHVPLPFTMEEQEWLGKAMKFYLEKEGIEIDEGDLS